MITTERVYGPDLSQQSVDAEVKKAEAAAKKAEAKKGNKPTE